MEPFNGRSAGFRMHITGGGDLCLTVSQRIKKILETLFY
jgi:hypothetical protein